MVTSHNISRGYLNFTSDVHSPSSDVPGATTLRTGDIYELNSNGPTRSLRWVGRRADFIQLVSGELLDPREPERALVRSPHIARVAFVGDTFGRGAANSVCAILQVPSSESPNAGGKVPGFDRRAVLRAFADVNGVTHPPLRVPPARVLVLPAGEEIPMNRKGEIWRKKLEAQFSDRMQALLTGAVPSAFTTTDPVAKPGKGGDSSVPTESKEEIEREVVRIVSGVLGVPVELIEDGESTFAEVCFS